MVKGEWHMMTPANDVTRESMERPDWNSVVTFMGCRVSAVERLL